MQLKTIGEFGFIQRFAPKFSQLVDQKDGGIGDDCAILQINDALSHVVTTDLLIEDIHFLKDEITPKELGYKSLAVNLSDIAAMGAQPLYSFLSIGIPANTEVEYLDAFMEGYYELSEKYGVPLMGGDTTKSADRLVINVAVIGQGTTGDLRMRSMAEDGDVVAVSGFLGDSGGGLKVMLDGVERTPEALSLIKSHHLPEPMINEGLWLAQQAGVHAMMDISDGISSDLTHILKASSKQATVHLECLPVSKMLQKVGEQHDWNIHGLASGGGEDYELLFTVKCDAFDQLNADFQKKFGKPLYNIGEIKKGEPQITWMNNGVEVVESKHGFDHFK
ncbi:thiamine-phosphate kinase [Puteibacter caeruleilacunae]|nr:thiamine-phosphate kinase [Puteibacter caeruleilacunae]